MLRQRKLGGGGGGGDPEGDQGGGDQGDLREGGGIGGELCDLGGGDGLCCHERLDGSHCKQCDRQDTYLSTNEIWFACNNLRGIRPELILRLL